MSTVYLDPDDLSALQAQTVVDFLNRAGSAEQLAREIEFPNELDIGLRLGQRLLDARAALGGRYTDIRQVRAVRLIGPERFTEICIAALGLDLTRWPELFYGASPLAPQAESGLAVSLQVGPQPAWLGQPLAVTVRVRDRGGSPRAGVAVTLQCGRGLLAYMYGFQRIEGQAVTVITGAEGSAELELLTPPGEPLGEPQQAALEVALGTLDAAAPDPMKLQAGFRALTELYLLERSYNLRRAIDLHVRDRREALVGSLNPGRWRLIWAVDSALLQADAQAPDGGGGSVARAVLSVHWKNWVGAWLEFFGDQLSASAQLRPRLAAGAARGQDAAVIGQLLGEAQRFIAGQPGLTAEWLGQREIQQAVRDVTSGDISRLPPAAGTALMNQLEVAATGVRPTSLGSYTLVESARKTLKADLGAADLEQLLALRQLSEGVAAQVQGLSSALQQQNQVNELRFAELSRRDVQLDTRLGQLDAGQRELVGGQRLVTERLGGFDTAISGLRGELEVVTRPRAPQRSAAAAAQPGKPPKPRKPRGG